MDTRMEDDYYNTPLKYKEICEIMNESLATGSKGRQLQLAKWQQFYDIDKIVTKYYIKKKNRSRWKLSIHQFKRYKTWEYAKTF